MSEHFLVPAEDIKACCATVYSHPFIASLVGESFHPGGVALTERLATALAIGPKSKVLDVACGRGTSAIFLAKRFGCKVTGVDLSGKNLEIAREASVKAGVESICTWKQGDAEQIREADGTFDAVICECALCTFPNKPVAVSEFYRVLKNGGMVGISDLTRQGEGSADLQTLMAWVACIADALAPEAYLSVLEGGGFGNLQMKEINSALSEFLSKIQGNLLSAKVLVGLNKLTLLEGIDLNEGFRILRCVQGEVADGRLGYGLFFGTKL